LSHCIRPFSGAPWLTLSARSNTNLLQLFGTRQRGSSATGENGYWQSRPKAPVHMMRLRQLRTTSSITGTGGKLFLSSLLSE
jgi:hypothetical protein